jgi:hydrogen peroxide-dependent heme synthase
VKVEPIDAHVQVHTAALPEMPLTVEGASVLHQMMKMDWAAWKQLPNEERAAIAGQAAAQFAEWEERKEGQSAAFSLLGHKGDLMFVHFRQNFDELKAAELSLAQTRLHDFLTPATSYVSIVELGLYESTSKVYEKLAERGVETYSDAWKKEIADTLERQRQAMAPRLWPEIPPRRYLCFYPMDRRRGEEKNWYQVPMSDRQRMMHEHGLIGRRYAGEVRQIITGSIGFDDWEWGVDLFADDPLVFKKLIYEMRFDEVSAVYALFGAFYVGLRIPAADLPALLEGSLPPFQPAPLAAG